jgi:hypothetical protein
MVEFVFIGFEAGNFLFKVVNQPCAQLDIELGKWENTLGPNYI